jgi:hypothetical protein
MSLKRSTSGHVLALKQKKAMIQRQEMAACRGVKFFVGGRTAALSSASYLVRDSGLVGEGVGQLEHDAVDHEPVHAADDRPPSVGITCRNVEHRLHRTGLRNFGRHRLRDRIFGPLGADGGLRLAATSRRRPRICSRRSPISRIRRSRLRACGCRAAEPKGDIRCSLTRTYQDRPTRTR